MFVFSELPNEKYLKSSQKNSLLFDSVEWGDFLVKSFNVSLLYGWNEDLNLGCTISIFKILSFKIGFISFPIADICFGDALNKTIIDLIITGLQDYKIDVIRIRVSAPLLNNFGVIDSNVECAVDTSIVGLQEWQIEKLSKTIRRNIRKGDKNLVLKDAVSENEAEEIYRLYLATVEKHKGKPKYSVKYFNELVNISKKNGYVKCLLAYFGKDLAGFIVVINSGKTGYYLHGGTNMLYKQNQPMTLLMSTAISWSKECGMEVFRLLASPSEQKSLIKYKERWGGQSIMQYTMNIPVSKIKGIIFVKMFKLYKYISQQYSRIWEKLDK